MFDVTVIGSANLDIVVTADRHPKPGETVIGRSASEFPGGKGLNQAVAAARAGASTAFVGAIGDDAAGASLLAVARGEGLDIAHVRTRIDLPTGRAFIVVDRHGENSIVVIPGANTAVRCPAPPAARVVLGQLEIPVDAVIEAFESARDVGATTVLNPAPAAQLPARLLAASDIVVPNEHEVALLGGVDELVRAGVDTVIVTRGANGVDVMTASGDRYSIAAPVVDVVDTTGAGDTFCGSLAARIASGATLRDAVVWAVTAGALAVTAAGAIPSIPDAAATRRLLARTP